ncbi:hypothetical protein [Amycolatopsis sp. NPDC004378]
MIMRNVLGGAAAVIAALVLCPASPADASVGGASCYTEQGTRLERCERSYQAGGYGYVAGVYASATAVGSVDFAKSIGYQAVTYVTGSTSVQFDGCPGRAASYTAVHRFTVYGSFAGAVSFGGLTGDFSTSGRDAIMTVTTRNQNWSFNFRTNYPKSLAHSYSLSIGCGDSTAIVGGSETIPLST